MLLYTKLDMLHYLSALTTVKTRICLSVMELHMNSILADRGTEI